MVFKMNFVLLINGPCDKYIKRIKRMPINKIRKFPVEQDYGNGDTKLHNYWRQGKILALPFGINLYLFYYKNTIKLN